MLIYKFVILIILVNNPGISQDH